MKGFLNKVQRRVTSSAQGNLEGTKVEAKPQANQSSLNSVAGGLNKGGPPGSQRAGNGVENTPRADVMLPRRERRYKVYSYVELFK